MEEVWKDIQGYEGKYQVSNLGRVKSLNYGRMNIEKILKPGLNSKGYPQVWLSRNGKKNVFFIHKLVASAYVSNDNIFNIQVNHKDEVKTNNRADNLEWCTAKYNNDYGTRKARAKETKNKKRALN